MTQHIVKLNKAYFDAVNNGIKTFEILSNRKEYRIGDTIKFVCVDDYGDTMTVPNYKHETAKEVELRCFVVIQYIQDWTEYQGDLAEGYCIVGFKKAVF